MENLELNTKQNEANSIIKRHTYWSVAAGLIPVPIVDIASVTAIQLDMLKSICDLYEIDYTKEQGKSWIGALVGSTISSLLARMGASAIKSIPAVGTAIGMASMSILSGSTTYALGNVFVNHFEGGGSISSFNAENFKKFYQEKLEEGKKIAGVLKDKYKNKFKSKAGKEIEMTVSTKLQELENMKSENLITEEEYNLLRSEIIKSFLSDK